MSSDIIDFDSGLAVMTKQPSESRLYRMDFAALLVGAALSSISSLVATNQGKVSGSSNVTISDQAVSGAIIEFRVAGGTKDENYKLTALVVDSAGNTLEGEGMLYVRDF